MTFRLILHPPRTLIVVAHRCRIGAAFDVGSIPVLAIAGAKPKDRPIYSKRRASPLVFRWYFRWSASIISASGGPTSRARSSVMSRPNPS